MSDQVDPEDILVRADRLTARMESNPELMEYIRRVVEPLIAADRKLEARVTALELELESFR